MSVKEEHPLHIAVDNTPTPEPSISKLPDTEEETKKLEPVVEERPIFQCRNCGMTEQYDCFGNRVPFNRNVKTIADVYIARDPFSPRSQRQYLILGSVCSMCDKDVCLKPECSIFYSKYFCSNCARTHIKNFPTKIQEKIKTANRI
ncbi:cysteine-rich DPF motif domain-containing protein 1 [Adelges cooleyi]|uniref:cysteine-rich DPF motif domain-containing protein 1 n=1 Tax=Adelges cooleyi TaxID=133065 RepID=UPI0021806B3B|nr:cysteine-rich DPF motif domain-containing protein 1 [Adelges cooleyi]XP_050429413.1 cysteine-rich DPF motif domain-containing protein 1 [Adelges cooleyi]